MFQIYQHCLSNTKFFQCSKTFCACSNVFKRAGENIAKTFNFHELTGRICSAFRLEASTRELSTTLCWNVIIVEIFSFAETFGWSYDCVWSPVVPCCFHCFLSEGSFQLCLMFSSSTSGSFFVGNRQANLSTDYIIRLCINDSAALALHVRWWNMVVYHLMTGSHFGWTSMRQGKFQLWDWTLQSFGIVSVCFFLSIWLLKVTEICLSVLCHGFGTEYNRNRGLPGVSEAWPGMRCVLPCVFMQIFVAERKVVFAANSMGLWLWLWRSNHHFQAEEARFQHSMPSWNWRTFGPLVRWQSLRWRVVSC